MIVAAVGLPGSGKTEVTKFFLNKGFSRIYFGDVTFDVMREKGLEVNERNERATREAIRKEHGMAAYAILNYPKIKELSDSGKDVLVESMYTWEEYLYLKERFGDRFAVVATYASQDTRAERMRSRKERPLSREELVSRDHSQIENLHQAGPIAIADHTIVNEHDMKHLNSELERIYGAIMR